MMYTRHQFETATSLHTHVSEHRRPIMFKKPSDVDKSRSTALGGKDVKSLKKAVQKLLPQVDDESWNELFPGKSVTKTKLSQGCVVYYNVDGNPMLLDPTNDHLDAAVPTVYALSVLPDIIPSIEVNACAVSSSLLRGSDLFLQGFLTESQALPFLSGQVLSVRVHGNAVPFAVGKMSVSKREAEEAGFSGRGLVSIHYHGDELWKTGDKVAPNAGFTGTSVEPFGATAGADGLAGELNDKATLRDGDGEQAAGGDAPTLDDVVYSIAVGALKATRAGELPMTIDTFVTKRMGPLKPRGMASLDLKRTKWKRGARLLEECANAGICVLKNVRKELSITDIDREHPAIVSYAPLELNIDDREGGGGTDDGRPKSSLIIMYKSPTVFLPLLGLPDKSALISGSEIDARLEAYCGSYDHAGVDEFLLTELFGKKERESIDPAAVSDGDIRKRWVSKLTRERPVRTLAGADFARHDSHSRFARSSG